MANGILKYTSRDYNSIKEDLISAIPALTDNWTSREESDPGMVLLKLMSAVGDMVSYNFDKQALEYYAPTVTQRKNAAKLFNLVGYKMHWYQTAETTLTLTYTPQMQQYIAILKQCVEATTDDEIVNAYYDYRTAFGVDVGDFPNRQLSVPPIINEEGTEIALPQAMQEAGEERFSWYTEDEPSLDDTNIKTNTIFRQNAIDSFAPAAREVYKYWVESDDTAIGLNTYIADLYKTLGVYSDNSSTVTYSLIPTTIEPDKLPNGDYKPNIVLKPYVPTKVKAIQGSLSSLEFQSVQLKNNRFYIPETSIDETYMYVSYKTDETNETDNNIVFLHKTDNLLTETNIVDSDGNTIIYFEFGVDDFDYPYIELSSYWKNELPQDSVTFTFYYFKTLGKYGNITKDYLTSVSGPNSYLISVSNVDTNNATYDTNGNLLSSPGRNPETAHDAYVHSLNYIMTYNTLVTIYDFERFTKRQEGITNALAVDGQRLLDLNESIEKVCMSYSKQQLLNILGPNADSNASEAELQKRLYNIQKVVPVYYKAPITVSDSIEPGDPGSMDKYSLNMYPIYLNFATTDSEEVEVAFLKNTINDKAFPYMFYKVYTENDSLDNRQRKISNALTLKYKECQIINVKPEFTAARVFKWRCCGTVHLNKIVTQNEANLVVSNIINHLSEVYSPSNVEFGKKIKYMDVIKTIMEADSRIQYFDAGIGTKKLIDFQQLTFDGTTDDTKYYNVEAYFNPESIMYYAQTIDENASNTSDFYNYITVDPNYIQRQGG